MSDSKQNHSFDFQRSVLHLMMQDDKFCSKASDFLDEDYFGGELKWFFKQVKSFYAEFKKRPAYGTVQDQIGRHGSDSQKYMDEYYNIIKTAPQEEYIKKELTDFIRANLFVKACKEAVNLYNSNNRQKSYDYTKDSLEHLLKIDFEKERTAGFGDAFDVIKLAREQQTGAIPTGIIGIDLAMTGGLFPQTWTTFLGGSNVGKSMLMPSLAYHAMRVGKKTFVTIHEDEETPTKIRFLSRFSKVPIYRMYAPDLTDEEITAIATADQTLKQFVKLRFMYGGEATIEHVYTAAKGLHRDWGFDLFLCDYGQCLTSNKFKSLDTTRLLQEYVYGELKQICLELNVAGAGSAQVNRAGHAMGKTGSELLRMTDVGEAWGICKKASNIITMNRSDESAKNNRIIYLLDKVRSGTCPVAVECVTDYSRCMTHDDDPLTQQVLEISLKPSKPPKDQA